MMEKNSLQLFQTVLKNEAKALEQAADRLYPEVIERLRVLLLDLHQRKASLVFSGIGKSGLIGQKMASTFSSLGLPSFFLHPTEALHGDLGRVGRHDALVIISKSGTTEELIKLMPYLPFSSERVVGLLGKSSSPLAEKCSIVLDCYVEEEACLNNLAPTTSTTLTLAMGDAMAVLYEDLSKLSVEAFAQNHPAGLLGKSLTLRVKDLMLPLSQCPLVHPGQKLKQALLSMTKFPVGLCAVVDEQQKIKGIIVEGDIRRTLSQSDQGLDFLVDDVMNSQPVYVNSLDFASKALLHMQKRDRPVQVVPVIDGEILVGVLRLTDLLKEGFVA